MIINRTSRMSNKCVFLQQKFSIYNFLIFRKFEINFFIIIIVFSNSINFIKSEKNIKNLKQYEIIENVISDIKIENVVSKIDPTIVIILDELNGYGALNDDIINTKETKEDI